MHSAGHYVCVWRREEGGGRGEGGRGKGERGEGIIYTCT